MMRRRMLMRDANIILTFDELVPILLSYGNPSGTDENGFWVGCQGSLMDNKPIITDCFQLSHRYEVYVKGQNTNGTNNANMCFKYVNASGVVQITWLSMVGASSIIGVRGVTIDGLYGIWYGGTAKIYDFYIKDIGTQ